MSTLGRTFEDHTMIGFPCQMVYTTGNMGTEIFPQILLFIKFIVGAVVVAAVIMILVALIEMFSYRKNKQKREEMKGHIVTSLITIVIVLIVYFFFAGIGSAFKLLFN